MAFRVVSFKKASLSLGVSVCLCGSMAFAAPARIASFPEIPAAAFDPFDVSVLPPKTPGIVFKNKVKPDAKAVKVQPKEVKVAAEDAAEKKDTNATVATAVPTVATIATVTRVPRIAVSASTPVSALPPVAAPPALIASPSAISVPSRPPRVPILPPPRSPLLPDSLGPLHP